MESVQLREKIKIIHHLEENPKSHLNTADTVPDKCE